MSINSTCVFFCLCVLGSWLETNTPHYYSECVRVMGPLMEKGLEKAKTAAIFISENTTQFILWVKEKTPQAIEWVRLWGNGCKTVTSFCLVIFYVTDSCLISVYLCPGERQHSWQCVPGVGLFKGAPLFPPSELHPASAGLCNWTATASMDQPTGLLQVSNLEESFNLIDCLFYLNCASSFLWMSWLDYTNIWNLK